MRLWHWRDIVCFLKLKLSRNGYAVKEMCGDCEKCNGVFAATGVVPCPMRLDRSNFNKVNEVAQ